MHPGHDPARYRPTKVARQYAHKHTERTAKLLASVAWQHTEGRGFEVSNLGISKYVEC